MNHLRLRVTRPGSLLSIMLDREITDEQYAQIVLVLAAPDDFVLIRKFDAPQPPAGDAPPPEREAMGFKHRG